MNRGKRSRRLPLMVRKEEGSAATPVRI
jgi:hypothetical protein